MRTCQHSRRARVRTAAAAGVVAALLTFTACSGGASSDSMKSSGGVRSAPASRPLGSKAEGVVGAADSGGPTDAGSSTAGRPAARTPALVRTGQVSLTTSSTTRTISQIRSLLAAVGGTIDSERTVDEKGSRTPGSTRSTLVLRVPVAKFDTTKEALERLGTTRSSSESTKDVTTQVIDVAERVQTLQNSLNRLQRFQRTARDVSDLIRYEQEITDRTSELQSLKAQQAYLADQTSLATITVSLAPTPRHVAPHGALDDAGFLTGLKGGWKALVGFVVVALTVLGAALPFALVLLVLGVPGWVAVRALLRRRRGTVAPETA